VPIDYKTKRQSLNWKGIFQVKTAKHKLSFYILPNCNAKIICSSQSKSATLRLHRTSVPKSFVPYVTKVRKVFKTKLSDKLNKLLFSILKLRNNKISDAILHEGREK
jgi:hypothetical protein